MNILIIDKASISLGFALECQAAGHHVKFFISPKDRDSRTGEGMIPRVKEWMPHMKWADLIFMSDNSYATNELDAFFKKGFPIFGCNAEASTWELNREKGQNIFKQAGLPQMDSTTFHSYDEAIKFVNASPKRYVSKPNGDLAKELSYCSKGPADMVFMLDRWKRTGKVQDEFILQDFHEGIEMGVGGWFGPDGWSAALCENWEFKKLMPGDCGPATGEMGTVLRYVEKSKLADEVLFPLTNFLHAIGYVGYCDVNCIIDKKGTPYPLEFTNRPGWPLFNIQRLLHKGDPAEWMMDKLEGRDTLRVCEELALGMVVALPPFPHATAATAAELDGIPIYGLKKSQGKRISLSSVRAGKAPLLEGGKIVERDMPVSAGEYLMVCSSYAETVGEAHCDTIELIKSLSIPNSPIWRNDVGGRLKKQLPELQSLGYAKGMRY
jgi:phosphoribosylamine--glycine ligase